MKVSHFIRTATDSYIARRLVCHVLGLSQEDLFLSYDRTLSDAEKDELFQLLELIVEKQQPLAYVLGYEIFDGERFKVNSFTLIPRPETEYLLMQGVRHIKALNTNCYVGGKIVVVDVGTGSGCIGISLMKSCGDLIDYCFLLDLSQEALEVVQHNVVSLLNENLTQKVVCKRSDLLSGLELPNGRVSQLYVLANLPYIPNRYTGVEDQVKKREPSTALYSGEDGLSHYKALLEQLSDAKFQAVDSITVVMEMMKEQYKKLRAWSLESGVPGRWERHETFHENIVIAQLLFGSK